jgi:hypothetical protein
MACPENLGETQPSRKRVSIVMGLPQDGWFFMENPSKMEVMKSF